MIARPSSDRDMSKLLRSLEPEILAYRPAPWRPGWFGSVVGLFIAVALGATVGIYLTDGPTWRNLLGFGTNTTETRSRLDTSTTSAQVSSLDPGLSIASMPAQAPPAAGLPIASASPQQANTPPPTARLPIASAAPQPLNAARTSRRSSDCVGGSAATSAAPPGAGLPAASSAPQPTNVAPARVATAEAPSASAPSIRGMTDTGNSLWYLSAVQRRGQGTRQSDEAWH